MKPIIALVLFISIGGCTQTETAFKKCGELKDVTNRHVGTPTAIESRFDGNDPQDWYWYDDITTVVVYKSPKNSLMTSDMKDSAYCYSTTYKYTGNS